MVTLKVIDEDTSLPIENAIAGATFRLSGWNAKFNRVEGATDKKGIYVVEGKGTARITYGARHADYYSTGLEYSFKQITSFTQLRHTPWNPELTVKLRKKKNPIPMIALRISAAVPELDKELGFDLVEADWVSPYGKGMQSDFIFKVTKDFKSKDEYRGEMVLTFSNMYDGISAYPVELNYPSELLLPHLAPENGYVNKIFKFQFQEPTKKLEQNYNQEQHHYFRIRSEEDENGDFKRAIYGKIHGDVGFSGVYRFLKVTRGLPPYIHFVYYLNPDYTRNTEYKYKANLYKKGGIKKEGLTVDLLDN